MYIVQYMVFNNTCMHTLATDGEPSHLCLDIAGLLNIDTEGWWCRYEARVCVERTEAVHRQ